MESVFIFLTESLADAQARQKEIERSQKEEDERQEKMKRRQKEEDAQLKAKDASRARTRQETTRESERIRREEDALRKAKNASREKNAPQFARDNRAQHRAERKQAQPSYQKDDRNVFRLSDYANPNAVELERDKAKRAAEYRALRSPFP